MLYGQYHHRELGICLSMDSRAKYTYSAPDRSEALYQVGSDETVNLIDDPAWTSDAARLRASLRDRMLADGYDEAFDGERWREYPQPELPALPGSGDRDPAGRGRQYPTWKPNPGVERIEPPEAYA